MPECFFVLSTESLCCHAQGDGNTPLDWAIKYDETETADLLRKHGGKTAEELKAAGN